MNKSVVARTAAGLQLKNYLTSKDLDVKLQFQQRWLSLPMEARTEIKTYVSVSNYSNLYTAVRLLRVLIVTVW